MASISWMDRLTLYEETPELFRKSEFTDITLVVEGKELNFAKYPLMVGSTVLTNMIKGSKNQSRLVLDDVSYKDMIMFLECLHPKASGTITDINLETVAVLAHRFRHDGILHRCEEYLKDRFKQTSNNKDGIYKEFFFHLKVADKCEMKEAICVGVSSLRFDRVYFSDPSSRSWIKGYENNDDFKQLSADTKNQILSKHLKRMEEIYRNK